MGTIPGERRVAQSTITTRGGTTATVSEKPLEEFDRSFWERLSCNSWALNHWKSLYLDDLTDSAIERIAYWADVAPSPLSTVDVWQVGGAITDVDVEENAFAGRHAPYLLCVEANWKDPRHDDANVEWVH